MKKYFFLLIVLIFILGTAACGHESSEATSNSPQLNKKVEKSPEQNASKQEESVKQDKYQGEPKKETGEQAQETANKVQEYVANMVNDLTIVENMSSDLQSSFSNSQIYGSGNSQTGENGPKIYSPNYNKQFENSMDMMKKALDDLETQKAPQNTEYFVLEPQFKEFARKYQMNIDDIKTSKANNDSGKVRDSIRKLQELDVNIKDLEISFADSIGANNYKEYDALLSVWKQGKNYQDNNSSHAIIASGIRMGLSRDYRKDFNNDLAQLHN